MRQGFVRILWGDFLDENNLRLSELEKQYDFKFQKDNKVLTRRFKIEQDIKTSLGCKFRIPCVSYVFGEQNYKQLVDMGCEAVLIHKDPYKYHPIRGLYKHKLDAYQYIMKDFDEIVYLDWDINLNQELPDNFWNCLNKKEVFQAALGRYKKARLNHRLQPDGNHWCPMGAFVYMRDKKIPDRLVELNTGANAWSCEPSFAKLTDEITGGWQGVNRYFDLFEPDFYISKNSPYKNTSQYKKDNICFDMSLGVPL